MSLTPIQPNLAQTARAFWDRPEGRTGKIVLAALTLGGAGALIFFWGLILPFLIGVAGNTLQLALLVAALAALTSPLWSRRVRFLTSLVFQQSMRWATGIFVQIDPIGILRTNIRQIADQVQEFDKAVTSISGARQRLYDDIEQQKAGIQHNKDLADATDRQIAQLQRKVDQAPQSSPVSQRALQEVSLKLEGMRMQKQGYGQAAGFQLSTIRTEQPLLEQSDKMYDQLTRIRTLAEFKVQSLTQQADMLDKRRAMVQSVSSALRSGNKILKGDPQQLALIEQSVEYLNTEASMTLGAMADFNRWSDKYLTDMDIQNGAAAEDAFKVFAQMEQKLALPAGQAEVAEAVPDFSSPEFQKLLK